MPEYLDYLAQRYDRAGGAAPFPVKIDRLSDARTLAPSATVIVNCTGCGARDLVPDPDVTPVRGQVVVMTNPGITEFFVGTGADPSDLTYLFPHGDVVVLGGTEQPGNWSREPDPATAARIIEACTAVRPELRTASVLEHRVGLRPARPSVRLAAEPRRRRDDRAQLRARRLRRDAVVGLRGRRGRPRARGARGARLAAARSRGRSPAACPACPRRPIPTTACAPASSRP